MAILNKTDKEKAQVWVEKIQAADRYYKKWSEKFRTQQCEEYYEGFQWKENSSYAPYTMNMVFSTIEVKLPSLVFDKPIFSVTPKPGPASFNSEAANKWARLTEDVINTFVLDPESTFAEEGSLAILDSFFRFGVIEVGFSADWISNPNAGKPILKSDSSPYTNKAGEVVKEPEQIPIEENVYLKRIPAANFRVSVRDASHLTRSNWAGYFEWIRAEDIKANKSLKNTEQIDWSSGRSIDEQVTTEENNEETRTGDVIKIWHLWDVRSKTKFIIAEDQELILAEEPFKRLPLFPIKFHERTRGFYPVPPVFNWLSPQNEINECREMNRTHRRRYIRKYLVDQAKLVNTEDLDKLENGPDGTFVLVNGNPNEVAAPLANADLGASNREQMLVSKDDMNIVTGTSSEARGESDRTTATQATLIDKRAQIRERRATILVSKWLCKIVKEVFLQLVDNSVLSYWTIKTQPENLDQTTWEQIRMVEEEGIEDFDFNVTIDVASMSPVEKEDRKRAYFEFLAILNQYPQLSMMPDLVRETADLVGYRNEKIINQFMQMAQLSMIAKVEEGQANSALAERNVNIGTPNTNEQITNQLQNQVGLTQ